MSSKMNHVRHGTGSVRPYLYGGLDLPEFVEYVFNGVELERHQFSERSYHVETQVGDSVVVIEAGDLPADVVATISSVYVYVDDVDATYARALELGATALAEPEDKPYDERAAGVKDRFGNIWWISHYHAAEQASAADRN
jgi:PhnB protein